MDKLLSREDFKAKVLALLGGHCCLCPAAAVDAHHILDRKLFSDGGYRLSNGAPVCAACHWRCETTEVSVEQVRAACGHTRVILPEGFDHTKTYDKWGNEILADSVRLAGPLYLDEGAAKILKKNGAYWSIVNQ